MTAPGQLSFHFRQALRLALNIFSYSQTLITSGLKEAFQEQIIVECTEFALHARRVYELSDLKIDQRKMRALSRFQGENIERADICDDYFESLNIIVHARDLSITYVVNPTRDIFSDTDNLCVAFLQARTDRRPSQSVSLYAISAFF